jgi:Holliday junction DNA helicase RuvA
MIARLYGKLVLKQPPQLLIDVGGVGYEVEAPMSTFYELPEPGEIVTVLTHLIVRDDAHILFGFASESERTLFRNLIKVSGVGPKMALTILSGITAGDFVLCVQNRDVNALTRLPGIGKKTAERLLVEMQDRLDDTDAVSVSGSMPVISHSTMGDAIGALMALGYKRHDADKMVKGIAIEGKTTEDVIREALQQAAK